MKMKLTFVLSAVILILAAGVAFAFGTSAAGDYPSKGITYIIPFNPGGQSDITAQYQKADLEKELGTSVLLKHMPGAGGAVAWASLVKTDPDGYTISGNNIPHIIIQPLVRDNAGYETEQLEPVYMFQTTPIGIAVLVTMAGMMFMVVGPEHFGLNIEQFAAPARHAADYNNTRELGLVLYTVYVYPFEIAAVILLVAIIAAIALTLRRRPNTKHQNPDLQIAVKRDDRIRMVKMDSEELK